MKRIQHIINALFGALLLLSWGCTGDFDEINRNPSEATNEELQRENYKIGTNIRGLQNLVIPVQEHRYQFNESLTGNAFAGYMGETPDGWKEKFSTFNPSADWLKWPFVIVMQEAYPYFRGVVNNTDDEVAIALAKLFRVAIMHRMTDTYGPIPYSKVIEDSAESPIPYSKVIEDSAESLTVAYDTQEEVYMKMFEELDEVLAVLHANEQLSADAFRKFDYVYYGDILKWIKYTNSLKLRMAILSYVKPELSKTKGAEAIADGVITANADNAQMHAPENRTALIYNDWGDHRVAADIISYMNGYNDPRRAAMFTQSYHPRGHRPAGQVDDGQCLLEPDREQFFALPVVQRGGGDVPARGVGASLGQPRCREGALRGCHCTVVRGAGRFGRRELRGEHGQAREIHRPDVGIFGRRPGERHHDCLGGGRHGGDPRTQPRTDHHAEVDRDLPAGRGGVVGVPAHGLPEAAARGGEQVGRHGGFALRNAAHTLPG